MLEVLLESRGIREQRPVVGATIISTVAHAAIVAALVVAGPRLARELADEFNQKLAFLIPIDRGAPTPVEHLTFVSVGGGVADQGAAEAAKKAIDPKGELAVPQIAGSPAEQEQPAIVPVQPQSIDNAYSVVDVDSAAVRDPSSAAPAYPAVMMTKSIEGFAAMRFVVDTTGLIDMGTVELLQATNPEFVQAVREAMPHMRFRPAKMGATTVRQLAEQLFKFEIRHVASSTEAPSKKP
jgi:outer membrane biosynthesis protein TonB